MIKTIKLDNFKIFKSQEFELASLTLITGINAMGKSSIIQSLLLLKQSFAISYLQNQNKVDLANDFINLETAEDLCYSFADDRKIGITLTDDKNSVHKWEIDAANPKGKILNCNYSGDFSFPSLSLFNENFIFLDAGRWGPKEIYYKKEKRSYNTKLGINGELTPAYLANAMNTNEQICISELQHTDLKETGSYELYENCNSWMSEILSLPLKARITEVDEASVKLSYNIQGAKGKSYSALQVGFGLTYCLPIIIAALTAQKGDMVIVENPEAHLHPSAQVKIGRLLALAASLGIQVIIESHSDHILNSVRYSFLDGILNDDLLKIIFIRSLQVKDNHFILPEYVKLLDRGKLSHRPADFFDVWDKMLTKLL